MHIASIGVDLGKTTFDLVALSPVDDGRTRSNWCKHAFSWHKSAISAGPR
jgi:hypothetical protein